MKTEAELMTDIVNRLNTIPMFSNKGSEAVDFDLSGMQRFCDLLDNPQDNFPSIHVAGTNGKGTTCRMLASIYQEAGKNVGLYTSPHLNDVRERFLVNGVMIEPEELTAFFDTYWDIITDHSFSYFEITTAIALWHFSCSCVDIAIIETGLGGRLDATNVIQPLASVITSIGLDHIDILGNTIPEIAREKAGIIKKNLPVVSGKLNADAMQVVKGVANKLDASFYDSYQRIESFQKNILRLKLLNSDKAELSVHVSKETDALNASIASTTVDILHNDIQVRSHTIKKGIENLNKNYPGKGVFHRLRDDKMWYFDGAHNVDSVKALTEHLLSIASQDKWTVILSFMSDKLNTQIAEYWRQFPNLWLFSQNSDRAASLEEMISYFPDASVLNLSEKDHLLEFETELVIFSGSFYFYSILSDWMGSGTASDI